MKAEIAAKAVDNREFRSRVRHFMVKRATVALDEIKTLRRREEKGEEIPASKMAEARGHELLARQIMANPDLFVVPLCIAVCASPVLTDEIEDFLGIPDVDLGNVVDECFEYLQVH